MKFGYLILHVDDPVAAAEFYTKAFGIERRFGSPEGDYVELDTGATTLAFGQRSLIEQFVGPQPVPEGDHHGVGISLVTDDVPAALARAVAQGAREQCAVTQTSWGQTVAFVRDPWGYLVELCTPVAS